MTRDYDRGARASRESHRDTCVRVAQVKCLSLLGAQQELGASHADMV